MTQLETKGPAYSYCLFCETGQERTVAQLCGILIGARAIVLRTERYKISRGVRRRVIERLLPGYVFVYADEELDAYRLRALEHVIRVLALGGEARLHEGDLRFARWVYQSGGLVGVSAAYREGDHVVITQGPLKEYEGDILWVDKRKGKAKVRVRTESMDLVMWLFFDYVEKSAVAGQASAEGARDLLGIAPEDGEPEPLS